jgi:hypothetical protein
MQDGWGSMKSNVFGCYEPSWPQKESWQNLNKTKVEVLKQEVLGRNYGNSFASDVPCYMMKLSKL